MPTGKPPVPLTDQDIKEILKLLDESRFDEMRLEIPGLKLVLSKSGGQGPSLVTESQPVGGPPQAAPAPAASTASASGNSGRAPVASAASAAAAAPGEPAPDGLVAVKAPMLGVFYRAPEPGAAPFVDVGSTVNDGTTVCLLEVMKLFNSVRAGVDGRVAQVCAENGKMVEFGQTLFLVEPEAAARPAGKRAKTAK